MTACRSAADADDTARRRHGDGDGVRSDSGDAGRSRRTRGKRALVTRCRRTRALRTLLLTSMIYSVHSHKCASTTPYQTTRAEAEL